MPTNIDVPIPINLQKALQMPPCDQIRIPMPKPIKITLPTGGTIQSISDLSKGIPTDCAMTFSLMMQIAPLLASTECLMKVLQFLQKLVDFVKNLPPTPQSLIDFGKAVADITPCFLVPTPANIIPFVRDILCLIIKTLNCILGQFKSLLGIMSGIQLQMQNAAGNPDLQSTLQCAQENAERQAQHLTASIEPVGVILKLAGTVFGIAGVPAIQVPQFGSDADLQTLNDSVQKLQQLVATLQSAADIVGGC